MKTLVAIALSLLVLFQSAGLCISDFFLLKDLVEHVEFHSEQYGDSFFTFLDKHYGSLKSEHKDQDTQDKHERLPFQHSNNHQVLIEGIVFSQDIYLDKSALFLKVKQALSYENNYYFLKSCSIFQPPKHA